MIFSETVLFALAQIVSAAVFFLMVYFIITLTDLDCDYINVQECCDKLNYWLPPKCIAQTFVSLLLFAHERYYLGLANVPMQIWVLYELFTIPRGNLGAYDPVEILNRGQLKKEHRKVLIYTAHYLLLFIIYMYCFILAVLKGDPINRLGEGEIITQI